MAEGLTFRFVFQDDGGAPMPEAEPGAASRTRPSPMPSEEPPAPRRAPEFSAPEQPERRPPEPRDASDERQNPRPPAGQPERRPAPPSQSGDREPKPRPAPAGQRNQSQREPEPGLAARLIGEMVNHLRALPGIGQAIGQAFNIIEPLLQAQRRLAELGQQRPEQPQPQRREPEQRRQPAEPAPRREPEKAQPMEPAAQPQPVAREPEPTAPRPASEPSEIIEAKLVNPDERFPVKPFETPAPRPVQTAERVIEREVERENPDKRFPVQPFVPPEREQPPIIVQQPAPRPPKEQTPGIAPPTPAVREAKPQPASVQINNPTPGAATEALQRLIGALGPLPAEQRALTAALRPLTSLGYTLTELREAVRRMREQQQPKSPEPTRREPEREKQQPQPQPREERPEQAPEPRQQQEPPRDRRQNQPPERREPSERKPNPPKAQPETSQPQPRKAPLPQQPQPFRTIRPIPPPQPAAQQPAPQPRPVQIPPPVAPVAAPRAASAVATAAAVPAEAEAGAAAAAVGAFGGPVGIAAGIAIVATVGAATRVFQELSKRVGEVNRKFDGLAHELAPYSSALSASLANAQVRQVRADVDSANKLGVDLARRNDAQSRMDAALQKLSSAFSAPVLDRWATATQLGADAAEKAAEHSDKIQSLIEVGLNTLLPGVPAILDLIKAIRQNTKPNQPNLDPNADIMGIFGGDPNRARVIIEGMDFGTVANPLTPKPVRGRGPKPPKGNAGP